MKVQTSDISIVTGKSVNDRIDVKAAQNQKNPKGNNLFAGNLKLPNDSIAYKRKEAMKEAMKIVGDAFNGDRRIDDDIERRRKKVETLTNENYKTLQEINKLDANKSDLKETYGITPESQEQLDLELLEKRRDARKDPTLKLSDEEQQRLAVIDKAGMTEYQKYSLDLDAFKEPFQKIINDNQKIITNENSTITGIQLERLKTHPMIDANVAADKVLDASSGEIIGMLIDEAKDQVDQKTKEQQEAAEKKAKEKKEQEDELQALKEKKEQLEALAEKGSASRSNTDPSIREEVYTPKDNVELILNLDKSKKTIQQEVQDIIDKMRLLREDIKGAAVDTSI